MTTLGLTVAGRSARTQPVHRTSMVRQALLLCGILSSVLYGAADIYGGLRYEGYSVLSQAVSELMAIDAPSERFVDPLFIAWADVEDAESFETAQAADIAVELAARRVANEGQAQRIDLVQRRHLAVGVPPFSRQL